MHTQPGSKCFLVDILCTAAGVVVEIARICAVMCDSSWSNIAVDRAAKVLFEL
jgi:hypothetical protein